MRKLIMVVVLFSLFLSACNAETMTEQTEVKAETIIPEVATYNLEDIPYPFRGFVEDKRTGCLYKVSYGQHRRELVAVVGSNGQVVGCKENASASSIEDYFGK